MIEKLLKALNEGIDFSNKALSKTLNVSEAVVEDYKNRLILLGYINKIEECDLGNKCSSNCGGCSKSLMPKTIKWEITEKGKKAIKK